MRVIVRWVLVGHNRLMTGVILVTVVLWLEICVVGV